MDSESDRTVQSDTNVSGGGPVHARVPIHAHPQFSIYMQLVTTASRDQQLVPTTRTQTFYKNKYLYMQLIIVMKKYEITQ